MKKIKSFPKFLKAQKQRQKRALRASKRKRKAYRYHNVVAKQKTNVYEKGFGYAKVTAPSNFSLVNNPEEMLGFFAYLKKLVFSGKSTIVDLSFVEQVTNDGLITLLSVAQDKKVPRFTKVLVQEPVSPSLRKRLHESGIGEHTVELKTVSPPTFGRFRQKNSIKADMMKANELIQYATRTIFGKKLRLADVQGILSECIDNTTFHANPEKQLAEMWWATVFCDVEKKTAYFSVLDNGIGILDSLQTSWAKELSFLLKYRNNAKLLQDIFQGGVLSRTQLSNRGNGLPRIFKSRKRKQFSRLIVITNNVYADFDRNEYRLLKNSFSGTFFYWEVINDSDDTSKG